jgi:hypothetical protein
MLTDAPPRNTNREDFLKSDRVRTLDLPQDRRLLAFARTIELAMTDGTTAAVRRACANFLAEAAQFYRTPSCGIRVLAARPLRVRERGTTELFGDYDPESITSFGTFLSTLCHEFCHHLDFQKFRFENSWHTRGFYERTAALYHHVRGTPPKRLFWVSVAGGRWRIDWPRTNRGS